MRRAAQSKAGQSGNIMAMIWMSIGVMLIMGRFTMYMIRGPVGDMLHITRVAVVETQIFAASQVVMMTSLDDDDSGDCDADGFVEPPGYRAPGKESMPRPVGGGYIPLTVGVAKTDPWGSAYGYCAWNHGPSGSGSGCEDEGRLYGADSRDQPVVAVISAGRDRTFQTTCKDWDDAGTDEQKLIEKASGSDDIILSWTYTEASGATGGLWRLKDNDPATAEIKKNLEVEGTVRLTNGPVFIGGGLQLSPQNIVTTCDVTTMNQIRLNTDDSPPSMEICDHNGTGDWEKMSGGSGALPDESELATCDGDTQGMLRRNTAETPEQVEICDSGSWEAVSAGKLPDETELAACDAGSEGKQRRNTTSSPAQVELCDSGTWEPVGASGIEIDSVGICDAGAEGTVRYNDVTQCLEVCNGTNWQCRVGTVYATGGEPPADCPNIGDVCTDGSIFAGMNGTYPIYTTPCDAGMTWNGTTCTGGRIPFAWNNANSAGQVTTNAAGDGSDNTTLLVATDSDSGTGGVQPHQAAQYCADLIVYGHDDWYLPSKSELSLFYASSVAIGNFDTSGVNLYWSSSENSNTLAWRQRFDAGTQGTDSKNHSNIIRCMRRKVTFVGGTPPPDCPDPGDTCTDTTIFAGVNGTDPIYTTPCDAGMTWNGTTCTGGRASYPWNNGNSGASYVFANTTSAGDGKSNTAILAATDADSVTAGVQPHQAAQYCADLISHGYDDWYLPSRNELYTLYGNYTNIGYFYASGSYAYYWSSSEYDSDDAWTVRFSHGSTQNDRGKSAAYPIRCVRRD